MPFGRTSHIPEADLSALLDAELRGAAKARCDAHLEACGGCRAALDELRAVRSSLRALPRAQARRSFAVFASDAVPLRPSLLARAMPMLSGATVVAFIAFLALVGVDLGGGVSTRSSNSASYAVPGVLSAGSGTGVKSLTNGAARPEADVPAPPSSTGAADYFGPAADQAAEGRNADTLGTPTKTPQPTPTPAFDRTSSSDNDSHTGLHIAEAVAAALALASGGLAFAGWRRSA